MSAVVSNLSPGVASPSAPTGTGLVVDPPTPYVLAPPVVVYQPNARTFVDPDEYPDVAEAIADADAAPIDRWRVLARAPTALHTIDDFKDTVDALWRVLEQRA